MQLIGLQNTWNESDRTARRCRQSTIIIREFYTPFSITDRSSHSTPGYITNKNAPKCAQCRYKNVYSIITYNSPKKEQLKCPSTVEWINKMCCTHIMEYDTAQQVNQLPCESYRCDVGRKKLDVK